MPLLILCSSVCLALSLPLFFFFFFFFPVHARAFACVVHEQTPATDEPETPADPEPEPEKKEDPAAGKGVPSNTCPIIVRWSLIQIA